jgi:hypothetical protein
VDLTKKSDEKFRISGSGHRAVPSSATSLVSCGEGFSDTFHP